jgi:hypothetical protein
MEELFQIQTVRLQVGELGFTVNVQYEQSNVERSPGHSERMTLMAAKYLITLRG